MIAGSEAAYRRARRRAAAGLAAASLVVLGALRWLRPELYGPMYRLLATGLWTTIWLSAAAFCVGLLLGGLVAAAARSGNRLVRGAAAVYTEFFRGVPLLVLLFFTYFALGRFLNISRGVAAVTALGAGYAAYLSETIRAALDEARRRHGDYVTVFGFSPWQGFRHVILPASLRMMLPPLANQAVAMVKDSSLVSVVAVGDLLRRGREFAAPTFTALETYAVVALVYLLLSLAVSALARALEQRFAG